MGDSMDQRYWDQRSLDRRNSMDEQDQAEARRQAALNDPSNQAKVRIEGTVIDMPILPNMIKKNVLGHLIAEVFIPYNALPAHLGTQGLDGSLVATLIFRKGEDVWEPKYPDTLLSDIRQRVKTH